MMRTREARRMKRRALKRAQILGHRPKLISGEGALHLYGCLEQNCFHVLECWDNPTQACGKMMHIPCTLGLERSWWKRLRYKVYKSLTIGGD